MNISIVIPCYRSENTLPGVIREIDQVMDQTGETYEIILVNDGSPDGTAAIVKRLQEEFEDRLHMIERKGKLGLGTAYITGFKWSVEHGYDYIFEMETKFYIFFC